MVIRWSSQGWAARSPACRGTPGRRIVLVLREPLAESPSRGLRGAARRDALAEACFMGELGSSWTDMIRLPATCPPLDMPKGLGRGYFFPGPPRAG